MTRPPKPSLPASLLKVAAEPAPAPGLSDDPTVLPATPASGGAVPRPLASFKLPLDLQERLRVMSFQTRRHKQDIVAEALDAFMRGKGF
jgi:hypothetical protein